MVSNMAQPQEDSPRSNSTETIDWCQRELLVKPSKDHVHGPIFMSLEEACRVAVIIGKIERMSVAVPTS
jgi:hypothetical protein